ncbi:hypothetical protein CROQUDRAFT_230790 [Cronartium quercuum f. sp. fusiforme G11]|uniref:Uncharacterized protein n=1 Tax=Cronartium quercuum f. sp. fusiforme G11 TaxID=708437 RepID=A0A9P6NVH6_9BASI|nr:hypothetical protein CROQUDRAFT_230790 [Cronartium quercuum f. sp. fusiforme G11]
MVEGFCSTFMKNRNLSSNTLVGPLPDEFQKLPNLTTILLDSTGLGAEIPGSLQELPNLVSVHLSNNSFQGNVSFAAATGLTQLYLSRNKFSGPIDLTTNVKIEKVVLDDNEFTGPLPDLSILPMLKVLSVARNHFVGLPPNLTQPPSNLTSLDIQSNSIVGPYPDPINATALQVLSLNGNTFTGQFPRSQAPPSLKTCHIDHVPTASCPPAKVQADLGSLANKCQLVCGKTGGSRDLNRAHEGQTDPNIDPHTVPQSTSSASTTGAVKFTIALIFHMLLLIRFIF